MLENEHVELKFYDHHFAIPKDMADACMAAVGDPTENECIECARKLEELFVRDGQLDFSLLEAHTRQKGTQQLIGLVVTLLAGDYTQWPVVDIPPPRSMMH